MNLPKEDIDFIKNLSKEMLEQDNRATATPYALICTTKQREYTPDGYGDKQTVRYDCEEFDTPKDLLSYFDMGEDLEPTFDEAIDYIVENTELSTSDFDIFDYREYHDITKHNANFFLTEKAYHRYIEEDGHNLNKPQSYVIHLRRNKELAKLYEIIHKLAKEL